MRRPCGLLDQAELDRVPVQPREVYQRVRPLPALCAASPVRLHVVGEHRVEQQRHVAEEIVEDVGLDDVVELRFLAQPDRHGEAALGEVLEEHRLGQQAGHGDDLPAASPDRAAR